ncbi:acyl-CoA dehydrogenase family protein [Methylocystis iwaonis]|uniref:Dibenzothiophene monooxygenase n=1 Tax=Methylocystis iwaonis TaxID=2885079 RepID=A0ABM8EEH3_9HYPH|nr:acyl-CoA dehydrogenase family protein [Methylocystis iwaonis]BDV36429.1 FMNH2-dependent monooxygenase [Methylocystis iwaonis]
MTRSSSRDARDEAAVLDKLLFALAKTAAERDREGGTAKRERDFIRESGLLQLSIPKELGGAGADWINIFEIVRKIAAVDSSLAHLFAFHHLMIATLQFFGSAEQSRNLMACSARENWFWGNALNPKDARLKLWADADGFRLDGEKSFCSGATDSDMLIVSAHDVDGKLKVAAFPTRRAGVTVHHDWDNMGQRQTDSGSVSFSNVSVTSDELLLSPGPLGSPFGALRPCLAQLILVNIYTGLARGALSEAIAYILGLPADGAARIGSDPFNLHTLGELTAQVKAAEALASNAVAAFQHAWSRRDAISADERGALAIEIASAKVVGSRAALEVGSRVFDVMGARATTARLRLDRFWRNARTHTLHDPLDHKLKEIGDWALNGVYPTPSFYS